MVNRFTDSDKMDFNQWIVKKEKEGYSVEEIKNLCVALEDFDDALEVLVDDEMWPDDLTHEEWESYVEDFKRTQKGVEAHLNQTVNGIDRGFVFNRYGVPTGCYAAYKKELEKTLGKNSVTDLEVSCQWIMHHLKNDTRDYGPVKGLVTGSVQSGKTANMGGLMSMAADYDWNFFIVLSGTIDNLRKQTRDRFKKDLQSGGRITWKVLDFSGDDKAFSSSELKLNQLGRNDFSFRYVTVCLKNKRRLEALIKWLYEDCTRTQKLRIIVIDDEADQASVNTAEITQEEVQERCAINQLIVNLVNGKKVDGSEPSVRFQAMNYVAYTATPYANVLNESSEESLYPKDFICTLPESYEYFGPRVIFGNDEKNCPALGIVRNISCVDDKALKAIHKGSSKMLPESFKKSLAWFLCVSAILRTEPQSKKKSISMLIHTTSIQKQHFNIYEAIKFWLKSDIKEILETCRKVYSEEINEVTVDNLRASNKDYGFIDSVRHEYPNFNDIKSEIEFMLDDVQNIMLGEDDRLQYGEGIHLCVDNCSANKEAEEGTTLRIVYPEEEQLEQMMKSPVFIVIGGNTLSRGLTIDGLVCSYFSRNSTQADSLMQMARWFGYRKGVELLQRIWMTTSAQKKFEALAKIDMDMKEEIWNFMKRGISPSDFGPRIRNIPDIKSFRITAKNKSQQAEYGDYDFRGDTYEVTDYKNGESLKCNIDVTEKFMKKVSNIVEYRKSTAADAYVWENVDYTLIRESFLSLYKISEYSNLNINLPIFNKWIEEQNNDGKYKKWNIAVIDGNNHDEWWNCVNDVCVGKVIRTRKIDKDHIDIGSLRSGRDALADVNESQLNSEQKKIFEETKSSGKDIVRKRTELGLEDVPLLLIYCIKRNGGEPTKRRLPMDADFDIIGISIIVSGDGIGGNHARSMRINIPECAEE